MRRTHDNILVVLHEPILPAHHRVLLTASQVLIVKETVNHWVTMIVAEGEWTEISLQTTTNEPSEIAYLAEMNTDISSFDIRSHTLSLGWSSWLGCAYFKLLVTNLNFTTYVTHIFPPFRDLCIIQSKISRTRVLHHPERNKFLELRTIIPAYLTLSSKSSKSVYRAASIAFNCTIMSALRSKNVSRMTSLRFGPTRALRSHPERGCGSAGTKSVMSTLTGAKIGSPAELHDMGRSTWCE
jgi:hypothetical protein